ncbi:hypothetical protein AMTRI_Chr04g245910 [Amborella trichopoda]
MAAKRGLKTRIFVDPLCDPIADRIEELENLNFFLLIESSDDNLKESALLEGFSFINDQCDGFLLPNPDDKNFTCQRCGLLRNECKTRKRKEEVEEKLDYASQFVSSGIIVSRTLSDENQVMRMKANIMHWNVDPLTKSEYSEACNLYRIIDQQQMELYHPLSIGLMRTRETLVMILMELKDCEEALRYCQLTILVYQRAYPGFHPLLGLQYYTCGKLEWFLGKTLNAVKSLTKVTRGATTPLVRDLMCLLEEARAETAHLSDISANAVLYFMYVLVRGLWLSDLKGK